MTTNQPIARPEDLLAHQGFLRGLVRSLVFEHEEAEEYLQETWAYAFRKPPRPGPGLKAWLAKVARNFIRQDRRSRGRRDLREAAVAVPETDSGTERAVERERIRRRVVDAVLGLAEPYRTAVVLRYLDDDLPPREIARVTDAPVETVRTRIKRALAMLRTRFDEEHDGDRRAWCMALVPLLADKRKAAAATGVAGLLGGILLMGGKPKIVITVAVLALLVGAAFLLTPSGSTVGTTPDRPSELAPETRADAGDAPAEPEEPNPTPEPDEDTTPPPATARVGIAFKDGDGRVLSVEEVVRRYGEAGLPLAVRVVPESLFTGTDVADMLRMRVWPPDEWAQPIPLDAGSEAIGMATLPEPGRYRLFLGRPGAAPLVTKSFDIRAEGDVQVDVHLPLEVETVRVRLVDHESRTPLAGATVTPLYEYGDDHMFIPGPPRTADSGGLVLIPMLGDEDRGRNRQPSWWVRTETHLGLISNWGLSKNQPGLEMEMPIHRAVAVTGKAWLSNGKPAAGKEIVWMGKGLSTVATVAEDGAFRIYPVAIWDDRGAEIILVEDLDTFKVKQGRAKLTPGEDSEITIGEPAGSKTYAVVTGRITIGGRPLPGAFVVTRTAGQDGNKGFVMSGADGTYRKEDVQPGRVDVSVWFGDPRTIDDFRAERIEMIDMKPGEEHRFDFDLPAGAFKVTVVDDETGKPIPGAVALARPAEAKAGRDRFPGYRYHPGWGLRTGSDGAAVLLAMLPGEEHLVMAAADGYGKAESKGHLPGTLDGPVEVTVRLKKK
jgi:RNA polymerase sigma-70 factor (ECF subfamily)